MAPRSTGSLPIEHRCAACGERHSSTRRARAAIGRPFTTCDACGGFVDRRPYEEWSPMSAATKLELVISELVLAVCAGLLPALLLGLYGLVEGTEPSRERFVAVAATGLVVATSAWLVHLTRRIRGSRRRMGDPMYRAKLIEFVMSAGADRGRGAVGRSD